MSAAQQNALSEWVLGGGRLIICVGDGWEAVNKTFLRDFLPRPLSGVVTTRFLESLAAYGEAPFDAGAEMIIASLDGESGALVSADAKPLVLKRRHGFGEVIFLAFDPTKSALRPVERSRRASGRKLLKLDLPEMPEGSAYYRGSTTRAASGALSATPSTTSPTSGPSPSGSSSCSS